MTSDRYRLVHNLTEKMALQRGHKRVRWKNIKMLYRNNKFKYQEEHGKENLNYLMVLILYQVFRTIPSTSSKSMKHLQITHQIKHMPTKEGTKTKTRYI